MSGTGIGDTDRTPVDQAVGGILGQTVSGIVSSPVSNVSRSVSRSASGTVGRTVAAVLLAVYVATLAPTVTYWDSGEFLAAIHSLGIPHPPGTPLYILIANVWAKVLGPLVGFSYSVNLLSAVCTASACGIVARLMARWTGEYAAALAGGLTTGLMSTIWLSANETEVYAPALLVSCLMLWAADNARTTAESRWLVLLAYLAGLGWALHLTALVAFPAALFLALSPRDSLTKSSRYSRAGIDWNIDPHFDHDFDHDFEHDFDGDGNDAVATSLTPAREERFRRAVAALPALAAVALLAASSVLFMLVRAQHDPAVNQGNPETWQAFKDVLTRVQYQPVSFLPRQAPWFIQIGNVFEYADWQVALGLGPEAPPSWLRTPFTILYAALGAIGMLWHRGRHRVSWRAMLALFVTATLGVIAYLNLKAGPSYGSGFLPPNAKHEARERDYFFVLAFLCWGVWAGAGAVRVFAKLREKLRANLGANLIPNRSAKFAAGGIALAALPALLNWSAVNRRSDPSASAALDSAMRILVPAPRNAVVFANGDNDTYPVWYAQEVEGVRRDVTPVTIPLLGATWYRAELARRHGLLDTDHVSTWRGLEPTIAAVCAGAKRQGRPVVAKEVRGGARVPKPCTT